MTVYFSPLTLNPVPNIFDSSLSAPTITSISLGVICVTWLAYLWYCIYDRSWEQSVRQATAINDKEDDTLKSEECAQLSFAIDAKNGSRIDISSANQAINV
jgi:hypothetical protein